MCPCHSATSYFVETTMSPTAEFFADACLFYLFIILYIWALAGPLYYRNIRKQI